MYTKYGGGGLGIYLTHFRYTYFTRSLHRERYAMVASILSPMYFRPHQSWRWVSCVPYNTNTMAPPWPPQPHHPHHHHHERKGSSGRGGVKKHRFLVVLKNTVVFVSKTRLHVSFIVVLFELQRHRCPRFSAVVYHLHIRAGS
jgi:hypothetical protein